MKSFLAFLAIAAIAMAAQAADPTMDALNATFVEHYITLSTGPGNDSKSIVKFTTDSFESGSPKSIHGMSFRSNGEIAIHLHEFNPLTHTWTVKTTATPDVGFTVLKGFLDDLIALTPSLPTAPTGPPAGGAVPICPTLQNLVARAHRALTDTEIDGNELATIVNGAKGQDGVTTSASALLENQKAIRANITAARAALSAIRSDFGSFDDGATTQQCTSITAEILVNYVHVHSTAERIIATKEALHKKLGEIHAILHPYVTSTLWRGPRRDDYAIETVTPTEEEQQNVTATSKAQSIKFVSETIVVATDEANMITGTFDVRQHSFFVAERSAAMVYNNLTYPDYGTGKNEAGETVIVRKEDRKPIDAALMLNLVMRLGSGVSVAHPFLQFGVSSAKDFPGFLAGAGFRFTRPTAFSISVGGMITRYKDLDDPSRVGKPVSGTAEIQDHLVEKTSPVALYGAIQLKF